MNVFVQKPYVVTLYTKCGVVHPRDVEPAFEETYKGVLVIYPDGYLNWPEIMGAMLDNYYASMVFTDKYVKEVMA